MIFQFQLSVMDMWKMLILIWKIAIFYLDFNIRVPVTVHPSFSIGNNLYRNNDVVAAAAEESIDIDR